MVGRERGLSQEPSLYAEGFRVTVPPFLLPVQECCSLWEFLPGAFALLLISGKRGFFSTMMILDTLVLARDPRSAFFQH